MSDQIEVSADSKPDELPLPEPVEIIEPEPVDENVSAMQYGYDGFGRLIDAANANGRVTSAVPCQCDDGYEPNFTGVEWVPVKSADVQNTIDEHNKPIDAAATQPTMNDKLDNILAIAQTLVKELATIQSSLGK